MKAIGQLLATSAFRHENHETIQAAAIISTATKIIQAELKLQPKDAQTMSYRHEEIVVRVAHGAVGGQIQIHQKKILEAINLAIRQLYPQYPPTIQRILVRQS